jgi:hypothetical protein
MRSTTNAWRWLALAAVFATLAGCSQYLDRRNTIALSGGNALASDEVTQMVDPWPRASANRNIAFNGAKMQTAVERYRTNRVITPEPGGKFSSNQGAASANNTTPLGPTVTQSVK